MVEGFAAIFEDLDDPRTGNAARHDLLEILRQDLAQVATDTKSNEIAAVPKLPAMLSLKGSLHADIRDFLGDPASQTQSSGPLVEADHGRIETRIASISDDVALPEKNHRWPGLAAIGKITSETAYYLLITKVTPERFAQIVRSHWAIEISLHWSLDVIMNEDQARARMDQAPHNLAVLRHLALNAVRKDPAKGSLRVKRKRAAWRNQYTVKLLSLF